jgi:ATP-dependent Clp protease ATP-binding subunit ClpB
MLEKNRVGDVTSLREEIDGLEKDIAECERTFDLNKAAELKYNELPKLMKKLKDLEEVRYNGGGLA